MAFNGPLWLQNGSTSAATDRTLFGLVCDQAGVGGATDLKVGPRAAGANMSVDVAPGTVAVPGLYGGLYICNSDTTVNLAVGAAPPSGQNRIDLIVATVRDAFVDAGSNNDWYLQVVPGVPGASATTPPTPPASYVLAQVAVNGGLTSITGFYIPDQRRPARRFMPITVGLPLPNQYASGSFASWGATPLLVAVPPFAVTVAASLTGQVTPATNVAVLCGWRVDISLDSGATWQLGAEIQGLTATTLSPAPVIGQTIVGSFSTGVQVRAQIRQVGGGSYAQFTAGTLIATASAGS